jgi:hypothetical protein
MSAIDINNLTIEQQDLLLKELQDKKKNERAAVRDAYEGLKRGFIADVRERVEQQYECVGAFYNFLIDEVDGFRQVMGEYGEVRAGQMNLTVNDNDFKIEVKSSKVKRFDERADMAANRLISFLKKWVMDSNKGVDDPMYQLAMMAIERNRKGDLDYKQISNLYLLEGKFCDPEYTAIMELFRESHIVDGTATHFYFYKRTDLGLWRKVEISFNML